MTTQKIGQEINNRIKFLEEKKDNLILREMNPNDARKLKEKYEAELDVLYAAKRCIIKYNCSK